jgi:glutathione S-transferase
MVRLMNRSQPVVTWNIRGCVRVGAALSAIMRCKPMADLILWHVPFSRSTRTLWLLKETGCDFRLETLATPATLDAALHPPHPPALRDGETTMHETGAMTEWLCETRAPHLWRAPGAAGRIGWLDWLHFAETLLHHVARRAEPGASDRLSAALNLLEEWLDGSEWLLSTFSGADCQLGYAVWVVAHLRTLEDLPALDGYLARCIVRPPFGAALAAADPSGAGDGHWSHLPQMQAGS